MSSKDRQEIQNEDAGRFEEQLEFNEAPPPPSRRKQRKSMIRVDHLSVQDVQDIIMENYSLRQELDMIHHQFDAERMGLERQLRHTLARNDFLETRWALRKQQERDTFSERRRSFGDIDPYRTDPYGYHNHPDDEEDDEEEDMEEERSRRYLMHHHHHPPPPSFGPLPPPSSLGPPPGCPPWALRKKPKGRYEEENPEVDEPLIHWMNDMSLGPLQLPHHPPAGPTHRRRKPSFM
ncbi:hypothetical protein BY458DRAFT_552067 [Sporodiniella umbellata]|nr:hypothetical protein BY458DRAFT_552067 [Sporodiniella umbellata]